MQRESNLNLGIHVLSIALVMSLAGLALLAFIHSFSIGKQLKNQSPLAIQLNATYDKDSLEKLKNYLSLNADINKNSVQFISKEVALQEMKHEPEYNALYIGNENPFFDILLFLWKDAEENLNKKNNLLKELEQHSIVYKPIILSDQSHQIDKTIGRVQTVFIVATLILGIFAFFIIVYLVKIYIKSKDQNILLMHSLGTPKEKIKQPYAKMSTIHGLACSLLSISFIGLALLLMFYLNSWIYNLLDLKKFLVVMLVLIIIGPTLHNLIVKKHIQKLINP